MLLLTSWVTVGKSSYEWEKGTLVPFRVLEARDEVKVAVCSLTGPGNAISAVWDSGGWVVQPRPAGGGREETD